jgi:O-antigen ligase
MIGLLASLAALLYCYPWLRPPELGGIALPVQRLLAWVGLFVLVSRLVLKGPLTAGPAARSFLRWVSVFIAFLLVIFVRFLVYGDRFFPLYFVMDLSKYAAAFAIAYLCYYALSAGLVSERRFTRLIIISGATATVVTFLLLGLYFAGFRTDSQLIAQSFNGALGVWPTGGFLPRLAGTTAEPQQLSVAFLTPLLLMLSPQYIRRLWPIALLTAAALLLSQSKFIIVSVLVVALYLLTVYRRWRIAIAVAGLALTPALAVLLLRLPTFSATMQAGLGAGAIVERLENLVLLLRIIREHPFLGIGPGHYGVFWGQAVHGDWRYNPGYTPNMDFLKVFAESGVVGFGLLLFLLGSLVRLFYRSYRRLPDTERPRYLAVACGALAILLNMAIGYELLHAFFWINVGLLLYVVDVTPHRPRSFPAGRARGSTAPPVLVTQR